MYANDNHDYYEEEIQNRIFAIKVLRLQFMLDRKKELAARVNNSIESGKDYGDLIICADC